MAAGLGFKTFTTGEVLTAADTNGYLMQGVLVFASAAARDAAITSPQEGQCCYLKDTDAVLTYSGAAWVGFDDTNAIQNTIVDAKGDLIAATAADTPARLAVGANDTMLVGDSTAATGLSYKSATTLYPWTNWTPTYTNLTVGNGTTVARYAAIGKTVHVFWKFTWGSTTSMTAYPLLSYPFANSRGDYFMGTSQLIDASAGTSTIGTMYGELGVSNFQPAITKTNATYATFDFITANTVPFTWTTGDIMTGNFTYEAA